MQKFKKVILMIESSRGFGRALMRGIAKYASLFGPWIFYHGRFFYLDKSFSAKARRAELEHLKRWGADGIIARELSVHTREEIVALGIPAIVSTVFDEKLEPNIGNIYVDNYAIGKMAAEHLLGKGFCSFAFCGLNDFFWSRERAKGFSEGIAKAGYDVAVYKQPRSRKKLLWGYEQSVLSDWLKSLPKPVGLMACIDERALDVIQACRQADIPIPEEIAVIGGDNDELICGLSNPQLSSVAITGEQTGYETAALLDKLMRGEKPDKKDMTITVRPTYVVARHSTDVLAISDKQVANALQFIRAHCREPIQVSDVTDAVAMTRQGLNKKFNRILGRSIHAEIARFRMDMIIRLLLGTDMSISEIAYSMGFTESKHLTRFFHKETGVSPQEYRKKFAVKANITVRNY